MSEEPKKKPGRPRKYFNQSGKDGAPSLNFRFDPVLYDYIHNKPQGPRQFLEDLVRREMDSEAPEQQGSE